MDEEGELHQYVIYEQGKPKGPKVIKLDDPKNKNAEMENYAPPTSITVHLSKIDMPELKPRAASQPPDKNALKEWDKKLKEKLGKKEKRKEDDKKQKHSPSPPPTKLTKTTGSGTSGPPGPGYPNPPSIPHHNRPPLYQQSGALNTATPPPPPPQLGSVVSNFMDRFAKR